MDTRRRFLMLNNGKSGVVDTPDYSDYCIVELNDN